MFDLEREIRTWKRELAKNPSLEDSDIAELEAALRDEVADRVRRGAGQEEAFRLARSGMGETKVIGDEFDKVRSPHGFGGALFGNYVRIALRKMRRQKGYSFITVAGLAVGLACCVLMMLWVSDEAGFDRFHADRDSIYRLIAETPNGTGTMRDAHPATPLAPAAKASLPEIQDYCRYRTSSYYGVKSGDKSFPYETVGVADPSFFTFFSFPLIKGDPRTALEGPLSVVLTESLARKLFGDADPLGQPVTIGADAFAVTGIMRDVPRNSHLRFSCVIPIINMHNYHHVDFESWNSKFFAAYVRLAPGADASRASSKLSDLLRTGLDRPDMAIRLQPLEDVHLRSDFAFDSDNVSQGSASTLALFSIAAAAVLLLACINFMNLATARAANRGKEVGLRKVTGARRSDIVRQFLGEAVLQALLGLGLALLLIWAALPLFNDLAGKDLAFARLFRPGLLAIVLGVTIGSGLLAGSFPALRLASFQPASVLKGSFLGGGRDHQAVLRKGLIVFQFALTVFFLIGTLVADKQLRFIRNKNLGVDTHFVVMTMFRSEAHRQAILADPRILRSSWSTPPGGQLRAASDVSWEGKDPDDHTPFLRAAADPDFLEVFRAAMAEGRFFSKDMESDRSDAAVINETAARVLGPASPLGRRLKITAMSDEGQIETSTYTIIGVLRDFHQTTLRQAIEPMVFTWSHSPYINLRIDEARLDETIKFLEREWKAYAPGRPFIYSFIDDKIDSFYNQDRKTRTILSVFAVLALFTACLGLVGLAAFIAEKRTKEIGIRKVLGASARGLVLMQSREFLVWVLAANVLAWPAAYFAAGRWLRGFAYRISPGIGPALLALLFSVLMALLSVTYKAVRAATENPAESLRYE
ncbi:MAG TPA: ABC transporter permease [Candidatus Aminicenantes bacterium]|nr:ABC transporter permease [Candidatus Aminicenantes bacterium]HRY65161.1 ABC transporter permease [Candidatus Aminicenantes bacterium]HRZ72371.1 ABC transporter permease [Candidatus Aminicenantes bacterium]